MYSKSDKCKIGSDIYVERATFDAHALGDWHHHPSAQLIYPSCGVMILHTERGQWVVPPQQGCWMPSGQLHRVETSFGFEMYSVYCAGPILRRLPVQLGLTSVSPLLRHVIFELSSNEGGKRRMHLAALFADELRIRLTPDILLPSIKAPPIIAISEALELDPSDKTSLETWSERFHISSRTLARMFVKDTGIGFIAFRKQLRLKSSLLRLAHGESVTAVALDLGFGSTSNFIRAFRGMTGVTPARYFDSPRRKQSKTS